MNHIITTKGIAMKNNKVKKVHNISSINMSVRLNNRLLALGVLTLEEVIEYFKNKNQDINAFVKYHNQVGPKTYLELLGLLSKYHLINKQRRQRLESKTPHV